MPGLSATIVVAEKSGSTETTPEIFSSNSVIFSQVLLEPLVVTTMYPRFPGTVGEKLGDWE
jgi:hypothetical protein